MADPDFSTFPLQKKGNRYQDFEEGRVFEHHWGRTLSEADNALFATATMRFTPLYFNAEYARAHGHDSVVIDPLLVLCTVVGMSVEDLSEGGGPFLGVNDVKLREEVVAAMEGVHLTARQVGDTLKAQGRTAALTADTVVVKLKQLEGALTGYVEQVQQAGFETVRRTDAVGRVLRDQTQTFDGVADKLEDRAGTLRTALAEHISELLIALDQSMQQAQPVAESFGRYGEALRGAAQIAVREAAALRAAEDNVRRGTFLRSANVVMEDLASTAVDLDKMLSRGVPRAMWRRYTSGDRAAVMRHLAHQIKDTELVAALRERISTDDSFRPHAIRFVTQFERLLRQAAENDPEDLLSVSLLTADVGKVYLALSKATNRL